MNFDKQNWLNLGSASILICYKIYGISQGNSISFNTQT